MHEIELGTWKALFIHLIRILVANGGVAIQKLNEGYRSVPTFGKATIRKFSSNASSMKKLAARDFEDLLQVGNLGFPCLPITHCPHSVQVQSSKVI